MIPTIYDKHEEKGIEIGLDLENGLEFRIFMGDEQAQNMIDIIQNKLNGR